MKKMMAVLAACVALCMGLMTGCGGEAADYTVGIVQLVEHTALGEANRGFQEELNRLMKEAGKTVKINNQIASGDQSSCQTCAKVLVSNKVDLILSIATPAAQAVAGETQSIPVLFTAVTDGVDAHLVESNEVPGGNVSGTSDLNPVAKQMDVIAKMVPGITKLGVLYNVAESNSKIQLNMVKEFCQANNIEVVEGGITAITEVEAAFLKMKDVQAIYIPTDNMIANGAATIHAKNIDMGLKLPIVCGEIGMNDICGIATYGVDYYQLGKQTAKMAFDILVNGADISKMPVTILEDTPFKINQQVADEIGFTIPQAVLDLAK